MRTILYKKWLKNKFVTPSGSEYHSDIKNNKDDALVEHAKISDFDYKAIFHQWGVQSIDEGETISKNSVAIIELPNGEVDTVMPYNIKFTSRYYSSIGDLELHTGYKHNV